MVRKEGGEGRFVEGANWWIAAEMHRELFRLRAGGHEHDFSLCATGRPTLSTITDAANPVRR
jgi:hypothetical protein